MLTYVTPAQEQRMQEMDKQRDIALVNAVYITRYKTDDADNEGLTTCEKCGRQCWFEYNKTESLWVIAKQLRCPNCGESEWGIVRFHSGGVFNATTVFGMSITGTSS